MQQGAKCLSEIDQSPPKPVMESMQPFLNAIAKTELLHHQDREVKLYLAACHCEITRITAPDAPYDDEVFKVFFVKADGIFLWVSPSNGWFLTKQLICYTYQDIFELIVSTFSGLENINSPAFGKRLIILETLARYRSCVVMLDLECDDLINEMFKTFFAVIRYWPF